MLVPTHSSTQLVKLGQSELIRAIDNDGIGRRYIEPGFNNRRTKQKIHLLIHEFFHYTFQLMFRQLAMGNVYFYSGNQSPNQFADGMDAMNFIMDKKHLPAPVYFPHYCLTNHFFIKLSNKGFDRKAVNGGCFDDA